VRVLLAFAVSLFQSRASLQLEILALRHYAEFRLMPSRTPVAPFVARFNVVYSA
jgi:hypothetical protein